MDSAFLGLLPIVSMYREKIVGAYGGVRTSLAGFLIFYGFTVYYTPCRQSVSYSHHYH